MLLGALNIRSVRLDPAVLRRLLDALDRSSRDTGVDKRRYQRQPYRARQVLLYTKQTGRDIAFIIPTRNISEGGLSFLHGQMMPPGQSCSIELPASGDASLAAEGVVVWCRHVRGMIHEVGLRFRAPIDLSRLRDVAPASAPEQANSRHRPDPS